MSNALRPWTIVMLGAGGLFTGGLVWYAWERVWIWRRLDLSEFAVDFRRSVRKADPAMPILLATSATAAGGFAWFTEGVSRALALVAIGLLVLVDEGVRVGLGVDGSASNERGDLLFEVGIEPGVAALAGSPRRNQCSQAWSGDPSSGHPNQPW